MRFSIIIAGYKQTAITTLTDCLALKTTGGIDYEIVFLDNTTDKKHEQAVKNIAKDNPAFQIKYVPYTIPGKVAAQNQGIKAACGEIYIFLDDDVRVDINLLIEYDNAFKKYDCAAVQGRVILEFDDPAAVPSWLDERFRLDLAQMDFGEPIFPFEMGLTGANMAIKADMFRQFGLFDERLGPARSGTMEDQEYSERIIAKGQKQLFWPGALVHHLIPPKRVTLTSFAATYRDVGASDYIMYKEMVKGSKVRYILYSVRHMLYHSLMMMLSYIKRDISRACWHYCKIHFYKGAMQQRLNDTQ